MFQTRNAALGASKTADNIHDNEATVANPSDKPGDHGRVAEDFSTIEGRRAHDDQ